MPTRYYDKPIPIHYRDCSGSIVTCEALGVVEVEKLPVHGRPRSEFRFLVRHTDGSGGMVAQGDVLI